MTTMAESVAAAIGGMTCSAGHADGSLEFFQINSLIESVEPDNAGDVWFTLGLEPAGPMVEHVSVWLTYGARHGAHTAEAHGCLLTTFDRPWDSGDGWRDDEKVRAEVLAAVVGTLEAEGIVPFDIAQAVRFLAEVDARVLTSAT